MKRGWRIAMWASLFIGGFLLMALVVQALWNWLIPDIFSWKAITYIQALGLLILSKILFKGFFWNRNHWGNGKWRSRGSHWREKWHSMSTEDKERFKQKMREKCGWYQSKESDTANTQ